MTVVISTSHATLDTSVMPLARYAQIIRYTEDAFFGINRDTNRERDCRKIWSKMERDMISRYLQDAQNRIEGVLGYPLGQQWFTAEQHRNTPKFFTKWNHIQALGVRAETVISTAVPLDHTTDPAAFTAVATTVTDETELHFYQHATDIEVYPSSLTLSGGFVTAEFPRARLVKEEYQDNPDTGLSYIDTTSNGVFCQEIDILRVYTDTTQPGVLVWPLGQCCSVCGETTTNACGYIQSTNSGIVSFRNIDSFPCPGCYSAPRLRINYCAGIPVTTEAEEAILHLAHALMPIEPCPGCDPLMMLWKQDRLIQSSITQDRANCMFGVQEGAWRAWNYVQREKRIRMSFL